MFVSVNIVDVKGRYLVSNGGVKEEEEIRDGGRKGRKKEEENLRELDLRVHHPSSLVNSAPTGNESKSRLS